MANKFRNMLNKLKNGLKLLVLLVCDIVLKFEKYLKFLLTGKHEIERICELNSDIYEKTMQTDRWLTRSRCQPIRDYFNNNLSHKSCCPEASSRATIEQILLHYKSRASPFNTKTRSKDSFEHYPSSNLEDSDVVLVELLNNLTDQFVKVILRAKQIKLDVSKKEILRDIVYRIVSFHLSLLIATCLAEIKYDSEIPAHKEKLVCLWNNLVKADEEKACKTDESRAFSSTPMNSVITGDESIISSRWSSIGFQGEDPGTDFRGMGLLGLDQLEYLSRKSKFLARDLLKRSLDSRYEYPFAITGINITYNLLNLYKDGTIKHLYYDYGDNIFRNKRRNLSLVRTLNDLYVELYLRFDCFWRESKPENILVFNELMDKFIDIIKWDMESRNFSMKFIY